MTVPPKWRARVRAVKDVLPPASASIADPPFRPPTALEHGKIARLLAHSDVPAADLAGLTSVKIRDTGRFDAAYSPYSSSMQVTPGILGSSPETRGKAQRTLAHETGHHVQNRNLSPQQFPVGQYAEATAENYADKHAGDFAGHTGSSRYDGITNAGFSPNGWNEEAGGTFDESIAAYKRVRSAGTMPDSPVHNRGL